MILCMSEYLWITLGHPQYIFYSMHPDAGFGEMSEGINVAGEKTRISFSFLVGDNVISAADLSNKEYNESGFMYEN